MVGVVDGPLTREAAAIAAGFTPGREFQEAAERGLLAGAVTRAPTQQQVNERIAQELGNLSNEELERRASASDRSSRPREAAAIRELILSRSRAGEREGAGGIFGLGPTPTPPPGIAPRGIPTPTVPTEAPKTFDEQAVRSVIQQKFPRASIQQQESLLERQRQIVSGRIPTRRPPVTAQEQQIARTVLDAPVQLRIAPTKRTLETFLPSKPIFEPTVKKERVTPTEPAILGARERILESGELGKAFVGDITTKAGIGEPFASILRGGGVVVAGTLEATLGTTGLFARKGAEEITKFTGFPDIKFVADPFQAKLLQSIGAPFGIVAETGRVPGRGKKPTGFEFTFGRQELLETTRLAGELAFPELAILGLKGVKVLGKDLSVLAREQAGTIPRKKLKKLKAKELKKFEEFQRETFGEVIEGRRPPKKKPKAPDFKKFVEPAPTVEGFQLVETKGGLIQVQKVKKKLKVKPLFVAERAGFFELAQQRAGARSQLLQRIREEQARLDKLFAEMQAKKKRKLKAEAVTFAFETPLTISRARTLQMIREAPRQRAAMLLLPVSATEAKQAAKEKARAIAAEKALMAQLAKQIPKELQLAKEVTRAKQKRRPRFPPFFRFPQPTIPRIPTVPRTPIPREPRKPFRPFILLPKKFKKKRKRDKFEREFKVLLKSGGDFKTIGKPGTLAFAIRQGAKAARFGFEQTFLPVPTGRLVRARRERLPDIAREFRRPAPKSLLPRGAFVERRKFVIREEIPLFQAARRRARVRKKKRS